ncbi:MAG: DUF285 domain-containing protein [Proteobacteria bacterium]|nr:DUF285 domain-containing protein [Pseudomonadota bacterium]
MISVWEGNSVSFPIQGRVGTIIIDWGDGKSDTITSGNSMYIIHNYSISGTHTILVSGTINNWSCYDLKSRDSLCDGLISIQSYGHTTFGAKAFFEAKNLVNLPTNITPQFRTNKMQGTFQGATNFNQDISFWDTSNVTDMSNMFVGAHAFNQPLNNWDTSNVTNMRGMFLSATAFNQPLITWDTSNVTNMSYMFHGATAFNQPLNNWNTSRVTDMMFMFGMAKAFNQPLDKWDISDVTEMLYIFSHSGLNQKNYCALFSGAYRFYWTARKSSLGITYDCN